MKEERKEEIANFINRNCRKSACLMCRQADLYKKYTDCPYLKLSDFKEWENGYKSFALKYS